MMMFLRYCDRFIWLGHRRKVRIVLTSILILAAAIIAAIVATQPHKIQVEPLQIPSSDARDSASSSSSAIFDGNREKEEERVLIVGSGAAGLFCAYVLEYAGFTNYNILEASSYEEGRRFGGRVQELPAGEFLDVSLDLGAEWIHGDPRILQDLLLYEADKEEVRETVRTISFQPQSYSIWKGGRTRRRNWFRFFNREFKFESTTWYSYLRNFVYPYVQSKIRYDAAVTSVDYKNSSASVEVTTEDGQSYEADRVVMAVPLTILQGGDIRFTPDLPSFKWNAMDAVYMSGGIKVWLEFDERFYPDVQMTGTLFDYFFSDVPLYLDAVFRKPTDRNCLLYFSVGSAGEELSSLDDEVDIVSRLLSELDDMYAGKATKYYVRHYMRNWTKEPFVHGAYSTSWENFESNIEDLRETVDHLYFAGEHTYAAEVATVQGAALSGRKAAQTILNDIAKKKLAATTTTTMTRAGHSARV